jgi:hypothetical protein
VESEVEVEVGAATEAIVEAEEEEDVVRGESFAVI